MRRLAVFAGAFSAGIFLSQYLLPTHLALPSAVAVFFLTLTVCALPHRHRRRVLLMGAGLTLALGWNWLYVRQVQTPMVALAETLRPQAEMMLLDYAVPTDYGAKVTVRLTGAEQGNTVYYGSNALLALKPGQIVRSDVLVRNAAQIRDDDVTAFTSKGVFLLAYSKGEETILPGTAGALRWWPARVGQAMRRQIATLFDGDRAAFLTAILTGDKSGLSQSAGADLSQAGLYHILAVSGMHCAYLLALVQWLPGRHRRRLTAGIAIPLLAFYALLTGGSPSVVRACVMLTFLLAAPLFQRDSDGPTALTAALFLILLVNPFAAASISLQLSFGAVTGLLWLTPRLHSFLLKGRKHGRLFHFTATGFSATMGALLFTVPLSAYYFGSLVLVSPLSNLLCLWAAGIVFTLGLTAVVLSFLWLPLGAVLGVVPELLTAYILRVSHLLAALPHHALYLVNPYLKWWLAFAYLLFLLAWRSGGPVRRKYAVAAALALVTLVCTVRLGLGHYTGGALNVLALNVGQGASLLLESNGDFALVDCGGNSWLSAGDVAADYLATMGCRRLDYLVLTHYDADHVNGVAALLSRIPVETLVVPEVWDDAGLRALVVETAVARGARVVYPQEPDTYPLGGGKLTVYPPLGDGGDNEKGLTVLCTQGTYDILVTGDMAAATERALLETWTLPDIEVLSVGHHGSKFSTSKALLAALQPEMALISVGSNSYGHPADQTLRRLALAGAEIYRTDRHGTIYLSVN